MHDISKEIWEEYLLVAARGCLCVDTDLGLQGVPFPLSLYLARKNHMFDDRLQHTSFLLSDAKAGLPQKQEFLSIHHGHGLLAIFPFSLLTKHPTLYLWQDRSIERLSQEKRNVAIQIPCFSHVGRCIAVAFADRFPMDRVLAPR